MKCPILNQEAKNLVGLIAKQLESEGFVSTNGSMLDIVELALKTYIQQTAPSSDTTIDYDTWSSGRKVQKELTDYISKYANRYNIYKNDTAYQGEMQQIKDQAIKDGTFMKAPNGKPTNLTERQWLQVRTKAFKEWFGDWEKIAPRLQVSDDKKLQDILQNIAGSHSRFSMLAKFILDNNLAPRDLGEVLIDKDYPLKQHGYYQEIEDHYRGIIRYIGFQANNVPEETFNGVILHEIMHSLTQRLLKNYKNNPNSVPENIRASIKDLYNIIDYAKKYILSNYNLKESPDRQKLLDLVKRQNFDKGYLHKMFYAFDETANPESEHIDEFISEIFTNPAFQEMLNSIPYKETKKTLWDKIKECIQNIFGIPISRGSVLEEALKASTEFITKAKNEYDSVSKVVDENGEPLVVYHGTSADFNTFEIQKEVGFHFGTEQAAMERASANVRSFFLNIRNLDTDYEDGMWFAQKFLYDFVNDGTLTQEESDKWKQEAIAYMEEKTKNTYDYYGRENLLFQEYINKKIQELKGKDYGVAYKNTSEDAGSISYLVFNPNQIKSATDNVGTFSNEDANIYHGVASINAPRTPLSQETNDVLATKGVKLDADYKRVIISHLESDNISYGELQKKALVSLANALFDYFDKNGFKVIIINRPYSDVEKQGRSSAVIMHGKYAEIYYTKQDNQESPFLTILHELLHIATKDAMPFDSEGRFIEDPQLQGYYDAFVAHLGKDKEYRYWAYKILNAKTQEEFDSVPDKYRVLYHATESVGEFLSSFVDNNEVRIATSSITYGEGRTLFDWLQDKLEEFLHKLFHGYSYIDTSNVLSDITDFLLNYQYQGDINVEYADPDYVTLYNKRTAEMEAEFNNALGYLDIFKQSQLSSFVQNAEFYSGAAKGSDSYWATQAKALGIKVKDYTIESYKQLTTAWQNKIEKEYKEAREFLGKPLLNGDAGLLTRRDMMQADKADAIFAIVEGITKAGESEVSGGKSYINKTGHDNVKGGTANAVARGIIRGIPIYVFDQSDNQWKVWDNNSKTFTPTSEPVLTPHAATIGTRNLNDSGKLAIRSILTKTVSGKTLETKIQLLDTNLSTSIKTQTSKKASEYLDTTPKLLTTKKSVYNVMSGVLVTKRAKNIAMKFLEYMKMLQDQRIEELNTAMLQATTDKERLNLHNLRIKVLSDFNFLVSTSQTQNTEGIVNILNDLKQFYQMLLDTIDEALESDKNNTDYQNKKIQLETMLEYWDDMLVEAIPMINDLTGISITMDYNRMATTKVDSDENPTAEGTEGEEEDTKEHWQKENRLERVSSSTSKRVRMVLALIPKLEFSGTKWRTTRDDLGEIDTINVDLVTTWLLNYFSQATDSDSFMYLLDNIDKYNKSLVVLRSKLLGMTEASEEDIEQFNQADAELKKLLKARYQPDYKLLSDFYSTFRNNKCAMYSLNLSRKEKQINATLVNKEDTLAMYIDLWRDNIENGNNENAEFVLNNIGDDAKTRSLNTDDISTLQDKLSNITNQLLKNIKLEFDPTSRQKLINQLYKELYAVLRGIGITIDRQIFRNVVQHSLESTDSQTALSIILQEATAIYNNLAETEPSKNPYLGALQNDLNTEPDLINLFQNRYINIAKALDSYGMQGVERMFSEGGSQYSSYTKPSFLGTLITMLSKPFYMTIDLWKQKIREKWGSDSFMFNTKTGRYRNKILQLITEESGSAYRNTLLHKIVLTFEDKDYAKWNEVDYLKVILSSLFRSESIDKQETVTVATPVLSDAASAEFVRLPKLNREEVIEALAEIVNQEFSRIQTVKSRKEAKQQGEKINEINVYDSSRGEKFCFIPALNNYQVEIDGKIYSFINALELLNKPNLASLFNDTITNAIEDCVAKELQDTVKYIGEIGLGDYKELKQVVDKSTAKAISNNDTFIADLAKFVTSNQDMQDELKPLQDLIDAYYDNTVLITEQSDVYKNAVKTLLELAKNSKFDNKKSQKLLNTRMDFSYVDNLNLMLLNHKVYQCNLILIITGDLAQYKTVGDFIKRFKEAHVPENKLYTEAGWDTIKSIDDSGNITTEYEQVGTKQERYITIADKIDNLWDHLKPSYDKAVKLGLMSKLQYEEAKKILSETNVSDGQSFRTLPSYRKVLIMAGKWNDALEMSYYRITHGISNSFDLDILMQAIKPFAFGPLMLQMGDDYTTNIYTQHKNSEAVILAIYSAIVNNRMFDDNLKEITEWAIANDIDVIHFESAVKTGGNKAVNIWNRPDGVSITLLLDQLTSEENGKPDTIRVLDYENCGIVASTPPHFHDKEIAVGTQMRRLMFTNLLHLTGADAQVTLRDGQTYTYRELKEKHDNLIIENLKLSYNEVYDIFKDNKKLSNELIKQIQTSSRYDNDLIEYCKLDEKGNFNFPFTEPSQCERIQQLFNSILKKRVTQQKMKGGTLIQLSCVFSRDLQIVTDENTGAIKYFECYAPAYMKDLFSPFIRKDASGRQYVNMNDIPDECRRIIGYRVPTESQYSMAPLYIKDFLPVEYGTSIVLPAEITSIAGSDFDIDKLYCLLPDIEITEKKIRSKYAEYRKQQEAKKAKIKSMHDFIVQQGYTMQMFKADINETDEKKLRRDRNNQLFEIYWGVLTSPSAAGLILNPGNFNIIKRASNLWNILNSGTKLTWEQMQTMSDKEIKDMSDNAQAAQDVTDIRTQLYMQQQNMVGKNMIALSAVHSVNYALRQGVEGVISVDENKLPMPLLFGHHYNQLNAVKNDQQALISRIVASFIPASTDVAKDPSLANLNMNETTGNLILTMAELGYTPTEIMIFMHLPSIQKILNRARFVGIRKAIDESAGRLMSDTSKLATVIDSDTLVRNIQEGIEDLEVIKAFLSLYTLADNMSAIIKTERCDSSKNAAGPYMSDNIVAMSLVSYVTSKNYPITNMKWINEKASTEEEIKQSPVPMLQAFFTYGIAKAEELFANMFYQNSRFAETLISDLSFDSSVQGIISKPLAKKAMEHYMTYRLSLYNAFGLGSMDAKIDFVKKFPKLLQAFKEKYPDLASMSFLQQLQTVKKYAPNKSVCMDVVAFKHSGMLTKSLKQQYKNQWAALLNLNSDDVKKNQQARNLAFALMQYNYIISGLNFNNMSFMHLCPILVKEQFIDKETGLSYKEMLYAILNDIVAQSKAVENSATINDFILQFALNNTNSELWKVFNSSTETNLLFENKKYADVIPLADILDIDETYNNEILKDENEGIPYQYIKIIDSKGKSYLYTIDNHSYDTPAYVKVKSLNEEGLYLNYMYEGLTQNTENAGTTVDPETAPETNPDSNNMIGKDSGEFGGDASASQTITDTTDDFMKLVTFNAEQSKALEEVNALIGEGAEQYQASQAKLIKQLEDDNASMAKGQPTPTKEQNACK